MVREILDLGFEYIELSHGVRITLVPGILQAVDEGIVKISSVHNFCPLPTGVNFAAPNLYQPSASNSQEQALWFRNTLKTIDFAHRVGAGFMVIHSGSVRFLFLDPEVKLVEKLGDRTLEMVKDDDEFATLRDSMRTKMRRRQKKFRRRTVEAYRRILPAAKEKGVKICIENREGFSELPLDDEMRGLLHELGEPEWFGYWHDSGHAELKQRIGLFPHRQLLEDNSSRQFGFHLHDVSLDDRDHQPIGSGVIDWKMIRSYIRPEHVLILELSPKLRSSQVLQSREFVLSNLLS